MAVRAELLLVYLEIPAKALYLAQLLLPEEVEAEVFLIMAVTGVLEVLEVTPLAQLLALEIHHLLARLKEIMQALIFPILALLAAVAEQELLVAIKLVAVITLLEVLEAQEWLRLLQEHQ
jgi:hypothetical protein